MENQSESLNIDFNNIELSDRLKSAIGDYAQGLSESCPSDANISLKVSKPLSRYIAELKVVSSLVNIKAVGSDTQILPAVKQAAQSIFKRLSEWKKIRFEENYPPVNAVLVDDDPPSAKLLEHCLSRKGCEAKMVDAPRRAMEEIAPGQTDLLVLDWRMPGMNGDTFLNQADERISTKFDPDWIPKTRIPVLVYSWSDEAETEFPHTRHFVKIGHVRKSLDYRRLANTVDQVVDDVRKSKQFTNVESVH